MFMKSLLLSTMLVATSSVTFAGPNQIDVLGLVPGVSDLVQVRKLGVKTTKDYGFFEIGGHKMPCVYRFLNGKLSSFNCYIGTGPRGEKYTEATNAAVHADLVQGFLKKFGKADTVDIEPVKTRAGVAHESSLFLWLDKHGNKLALLSMTDTMSRGALVMESLENRQQQALEESKKEASRKY